MGKTSNILLLAVFLVVTLAQNCTPFGTRLQYGDHLRDINSSNIVTISFNTPDPCTTSFLRLLTSTGFQQVTCESVIRVMSKNMSYYNANIQRCDLHTEVAYNKTFHYMVYGWQSDKQDKPTAGMSEYIEVNMPDPRKHDGEMNVMVMADWGPSYTTGMIPVHEEFRKVHASRRINLLVLVGDVAYNLNSRNGQNYIQFLQFASQILSQVPCALVPGNHDDYSDDDKILLNSTFLLYNVTLNTATGFAFGDAYILLYDPYNVLEQFDQPVSSLDMLKAELQRGYQLGLFIIPMSHYPIMCNGESIRCAAQGLTLYPYHAAMMDAGVNLHIGAHAHQYNRIYPYYRNKTFIPSESPYQDDEEYIVSIVEGVAGSNTDIVVEMDFVFDYTASYTQNQTGFGIVTVNSNQQIHYRHYSTVRGLTDEMTIEKVRVRSKKQDKQDNKKKEESEDKNRSYKIIDAVRETLSSLRRGIQILTQ